MAIFEAITFTWEGKDYTVPPDQVMRCIAKVEDVITLAQLHQHLQNRSMPLGKLASAFGIALRHAGAQVSDEEVYDGMFKSGEMQSRALQAVHTLQALMIPPEHLRAAPGKAGAVAAAPSSKKRSKSL